MIRPADVDAAAAALADAGFLAPEAEATELAAASADPDDLQAKVERRTTGEPLAWIRGVTTFCGEVIRVDPGVYVPRRQTQPMAEAAAGLLAPDGIAVDLCTGSGAVAAVLARRRPGARVLGTDLDPTAVRCARANGVDVVEGDLAAGLPDDLAGAVDLVTAVVPYVPSEALHLLPRDVLAHEPRLALDGGPAGALLLGRTVAAAARLLRLGGWLLIELGGDQDRSSVPLLVHHGFDEIRRHHDDDGDLRWIQARRASGGADSADGLADRPGHERRPAEVGRWWTEAGAGAHGASEPGSGRVGNAAMSRAGSTPDDRSRCPPLASPRTPPSPSGPTAR